MYRRHYNRIRRSLDAPNRSWVHARAMPKKRKIRKSVKSKPFRRCLSSSLPSPLFPFLTLSAFLWSMRHLTPNFLRPLHLRPQISYPPSRSKPNAFNTLQLPEHSHEISVKLGASWGSPTYRCSESVPFTPSFSLGRKSRARNRSRCSAYFSERNQVKLLNSF